jgi:cytoskeletal protein CcmA (bactofilin family)
MIDILKPKQPEIPSNNPMPEPARPIGLVPKEPTVNDAASNVDKPSIGKGLIFVGDITGTESIFIDGKIEGSISLPGNRVTVGRNGHLDTTINARDILVMGKVRGNLCATDRVEIRSTGTVIGDLVAARVSIEDGAFFKGSIDIRKTEAKAVHSVNTTPIHSVNTAVAVNETLRHA